MDNALKNNIYNVIYKTEKYNGIPVIYHCFVVQQRIK